MDPGSALGESAVTRAPFFSEAIISKGVVMIIDDNRVKTERQRLEKLLDVAEVPKQQRAVLEAVIDNLAWQRIKLDEAREEMENASIVCEYDNGGGQRGVRKNPIFVAYVDLWRAYMTGLEKYSSYLPKEAREEIVSSSMSVLDQVKQMQKARSN